MELPTKFNADIIFMVSAGEISEIEAREACIYCNYNWTQFGLLEPHERAEAIAQYRLHHMIEAHVNDASEKASEARSRQGAGGT